MQDTLVVLGRIESFEFAVFSEVSIDHRPIFRLWCAWFDLSSFAYCLQHKFIAWIVGRAASSLLSWINISYRTLINSASNPWRRICQDFPVWKNIVDFDLFPIALSDTRFVQFHWRFVLINLDEVERWFSVQFCAIVPFDWLLENSVEMVDIRGLGVLSLGPTGIYLINFRRRLEFRELSLDFILLLLRLPLTFKFTFYLFIWWNEPEK